MVHTTKRLLFFTLFLILTLITITSAVKAEEAFTVYNIDSQVDACLCSAFTDSFMIKNNGVSEFLTIVIDESGTDRTEELVGTQAAFIIEASGSAARFVKLLPNTVAIDSGKTATVQEIFNIPCSTRQGVYELIITIKTVGGLEKTYKQNIVIGDCPNNELVFQYSSVSTCPCQPIVFNFSQRNTATFSDVYDFWVSDYADYSLVGPTPMILEPWQTGRGSLIINLSCDIYGNKSMEFYSASRTGKHTLKVPLNLQIEPCYNFSVGFNDRIDICSYYEVEYPLSIKNDVHIPNTYYISFSGNDSHIASTDVDIVTLAPNESKTVMVKVKAPENAGYYSFDIDVKTEIGPQAVKKTVPVYVDDCYRAEVFSLVQGDATGEDVPAGFCCDESVEYRLGVRNTGSRDLDLVFSFENSTGFSLEDDDMKLESGEEDVVVIMYERGCDDFVSQKVSNILNVYREDNGMVYSYPFELDMYSYQDCARLVLESPERISTFYKEGYYTLFFKNNGIRSARYDLEIKNDDGWLEIEERTLRLAPGEIDNLTLRVSPDMNVEKGLYNIPISVDVRNRANGNPDIIMPVNLRINYVRKMLDWFGGAADAFGGNVSKAYTGTRDYFFARPYDDTCSESSQKEIDEIIEYLEKKNITYSYVYHFMKEDTDYQINLSEFFVDPDEDSLTYKADSSEHLSIQIDGPVAIVTPDKDFCGVEYSIFSASDNKGGTAESTEFWFIVENQPEPSRWERFKSAVKPMCDRVGDFIYQYRYYFAAGLLILILILVLLSVRGKPKKKEPIVKRITLDKQDAEHESKTMAAAGMEKKQVKKVSKKAKKAKSSKK